MIDIDESTLNNVFEYILKRFSEAAILYIETIKFWDENKDNKTRDYQEQTLAKIRKAEIHIKWLTEDLDALKYSFYKSGLLPRFNSMVCDLHYMFSKIKWLEYTYRMKKSLSDQED